MNGSRTWYLPFGGYRPGSAPTQTISDRDFTGQKENMELGLLYYNARYYVPGLGRFASADTIVPNPTNPQSYNRYSYVRNSPLNLTDPTGHYECDVNGLCIDAITTPTPQKLPLGPLVKFTGVAGQNWTNEEKAAVQQGAWQVAMALFQAGEGQFSSAREAFLTVYDGAVTFHKTGSDGCPTKVCYGEWVGNNKVNVYTDIYRKDAEGRLTDKSNIPEEWAGPRWAIHELGHGFEAKVNDLIANDIRDNLPADVANRAGFAGPPYGWQQNNCAINCNGEIFADMYVGWTYGQWETDRFGLTGAASLKSDYMTTNMSEWIDIVSP